MGKTKLKIELAVCESDLKMLQTACQLTNVDIIESKKIDGLFGGGFDVVLSASCPHDLYSLGTKVSELKYKLLT